MTLNPKCNQNGPKMNENEIFDKNNILENISYEIKIESKNPNSKKLNSCGRLYLTNQRIILVNVN